MQSCEHAGSLSDRRRLGDRGAAPWIAGSTVSMSDGSTSLNCRTDQMLNQVWKSMHEEWIFQQTVTGHVWNAFSVTWWENKSASESSSNPQLVKHETMKLTATSDSDWRGCVTTRKSTTGIVLRYARSTIATMSRTQGSVSLSSPEAEHYGIASALAEAKQVEEILGEYLISIQGKCRAPWMYHPAWVEHHTGGSRSTPTVHPFWLRSGGRGWLNHDHARTQATRDARHAVRTARTLFTRTWLWNKGGEHRDGFNLNYRICCWVQYGTEGREYLRQWISENCEEFRGTQIVRHAKHVGTMIGPDGHLHRWTAHRKIIQRVLKINASTKSLVERLCDFQIYAISVLSFIGLVCAPDKATLKAENHALQCTTAGPCNAIPSSLLRLPPFVALVLIWWAFIPSALRLAMELQHARPRSAKDLGKSIRLVGHNCTPFCSLSLWGESISCSIHGL